MKIQKTRLTIAYQLLKLEIAKGHMKWKIADLARLSKVSRPLIYYHFGKTKMEILLNAIQVAAEDYYALVGPRSEYAKKGRFTESVLVTRKILLDNPWVATFSQKWRFEEGEISRKLEYFESCYRRKLHESFPHLTHPQILMLHSHLHGIVTAPFLTPEEIRDTLDRLSREYKLPTTG